MYLISVLKLQVRFPLGHQFIMTRVKINLKRIIRNFKWPSFKSTNLIFFRISKLFVKILETQEEIDKNRWKNTQYKGIFAIFFFFFPETFFSIKIPTYRKNAFYGNVDKNVIRKFLF